MIDALCHRVYLWSQYVQARAKRRKDSTFRIRPYLEGLTTRLSELPATGQILSVGPRNGIELDLLEEAFPNRTVWGLDVFSTDPRILVGDMHHLRWPDSSMALVWASHCLEHARHPAVVLHEIARVLKDQGVLFFAYPTGFRPNFHDRFDFGQPSEGLLPLIPQCWRAKVFWEEQRAGSEWLGALRVFKDTYR